VPRTGAPTQGHQDTSQINPRKQRRPTDDPTKEHKNRMDRAWETTSRSIRRKRPTDPVTRSFHHGEKREYPGASRQGGCSSDERETPKSQSVGARQNGRNGDPARTCQAKNLKTRKKANGMLGLALKGQRQHGAPRPFKRE